MVKVRLPGAQLKNIDLQVTGQKFLVQSPKYKLCTYLPKPVVDTEGKAKWDKSKEELSVTLPLLLDEEARLMRGEI